MQTNSSSSSNQISSQRSAKLVTTDGSGRLVKVRVFVVLEEVWESVLESDQGSMDHTMAHHNGWKVHCRNRRLCSPGRWRWR